MNRQHIIIRLMLCTALLSGFVPMAGVQRAQAQVDVSFQVFYDQLSPYGSWVSYPDYGYVWVPGVGSGFRPYGTRGHWVYTEDGWAWVSDYSWGWATFHYGNWFYDDSYGWMWMPGYEWAPAWVTWGEYQGNYCWAPVGPRIDIGVSFGSYRPPVRYWNFCPREHIMSTRVSNYYVTNVRNTTVINNITVINNVNRGGGRGAYLRGPQPDHVERFTHRQIRPLAVQSAPRPGAPSVQGGRLAIYRPNVQHPPAGGQGAGAPRPSTVRELHSLPPGNRPAPRPAGQQPGGRPGQQQTPRPGQQSAPRPAPQQTHPNPPQQQQQPRPMPQQPSRPSPRPAPQPQQQQPRPMPQQPHPTPQQQQPRPAPQQRPSQPAPRPMPQQPRPMPQQPRPAPQQPRPQQQQPRPNPQPRPAPRPQPQPHQPPPHQNPPPAPRPGEHH